MPYRTLRAGRPSPLRFSSLAFVAGLRFNDADITQVPKLTPNHWVPARVSLRSLLCMIAFGAIFTVSAGATPVAVAPHRACAVRPLSAAAVRMGTRRLAQ